MAFAVVLAAKFHSRLHLLHVVGPPVLPEWGYARIPRREAKHRREAEERLPQLPLECGIGPKLVHSACLRSGEAADEICMAATEGHCDLVVLAGHGLGGIQHAFVGSTTERVVRRASCPVLTVRDRVRRKKGEVTPSFDLKRIMVTTDFSDASKKAFLTRSG